MDSAGGDVGGPGGDVGGVSGDEAAWRELVERFDLPYDADPAHSPWPDSENVADEPRLPRRGQGPPWPDASPPGRGGWPAHDQPGMAGGPGSASEPRSAGGPGSADRAGPGPVTSERAGPGQAPPDQAGRSPAGPGQAGSGQAGPGQAGASEAGPVSGRARIVRPATPPHTQRATDLPGDGPAGGAAPGGVVPGNAAPGSAPDAGTPGRRAPGAGRGGQHRSAEQPGALDDDGRYVPPQPPPLPKLSPAAKGAWAALCGGPAYLLVATLLGWQIPGWAALVAVAAFVGGFTAVILRMEDRPPRDGDGGGDNGAVV